MDFYFWMIVIIGGAIVGAVALIPYSESTQITPAFSKIIVNGDEYTATKYNDVFHVNTTGSIITNVTGNTAIIKLDEQTCAAAAFFKSIDSDGNLVCGT